MNKFKVYLSGATKHVDEKFQDWRNVCTSLSQTNFLENIKFIDPITYFNYTNKIPMSEKQCLDLFMWQIRQSDLLLVNLDHSDNSIGTSMEIEHAYCNNIPIIAFGSKPDTWYNWIGLRASVILDNLDDAIDYITNYYGKVVCE